MPFPTTMTTTTTSNITIISIDQGSFLINFPFTKTSLVTATLITHHQPLHHRHVSLSTITIYVFTPTNITSIVTLIGYLHQPPNPHGNHHLTVIYIDTKVYTTTTIRSKPPSPQHLTKTSQSHCQNFPHS